MTGKERKNIIASVLARLRGTSKSSGAPFQQVLQLYAMERFLYRISKSKHAKSVILKGALLLKTIGIPSARPTMDIDMLRKGKADQATLRLGARPQADRVPLCGAYKGLEFSGSSFSVATIQQKFAHHVAAMHLRRCFGDVHLAGNLLVQPLYPCTRIARSRGVNSS